MTTGYFAAAGTRILQGRAFTRGDSASSSLVAIVNDRVARRYWNGAALGHRIRVGRGPWATIVGVAENTNAESLVEAPEPFLYLPIAQRADARRDDVNVFVRVEGDTAPAAALVSAVLKQVSPDVPVYGVESLSRRIRELVMPMQMGAVLFSAFAAVALTLSVIGIYGVATLLAAQRTREIGIRIALGANRPAIVGLVLRWGALPILGGIAAGLVASAWTARLISAFLFEVTPRDPVTLSGVAAALGIVATLASYLPARRAATVDPVVALRND